MTQWTQHVRNIYRWQRIESESLNIPTAVPWSNEITERTPSFVPGFVGLKSWSSGELYEMPGIAAPKSHSFPVCLKYLGLTFVVIYHILVFWLDARRASSTNQLITGGFFMIVASFAFVVSFFLHLVCSHNIIDRVHRPTVVKQDIAAVN